MHEAELVGTEVPERGILNLLREQGTQLQAIAIVGSAGSGKSTLGMRAFQSAETAESFQCRASTTVSQTFNIKTILCDLTEQVGPPLPKKDLETKALEDKLRSNLKDKKYLIVLDDIWSISAWKSIQAALPDNNKGSRIIVTTRNKDVANSCCSPYPGSNIYEIKPLSEDDCRELFFRLVFRPNGTCPPELKRISNDIIRKCRGLPLAIVSIASLLASKPSKTRDEWQKILDRFGSELETNPMLESMRHILTLSYNDLPYHLKACALYFGVFPGAGSIRRKRMVRRWIAEGFVSEMVGQSVEDVAEGYFDELVGRSIIQPVEISLDSKVKSYAVHAMMLEVIVSLSIEENFVTIFGGQYMTMMRHNKARRLSLLPGSDDPSMVNTRSLSHVRSLTMFSDSKPPRVIPPLLRLLRVLDLEDCLCIKDAHLKNVYKLYHLKYLGLRNTGVSKLPKQIGELEFLETLDIRRTAIGDLPAGVVYLRSLKHILAGSTSSFLYGDGQSDWCKPVRLPCGVGDMTSLQTLAYVETKENADIGRLTQLRKLGIVSQREEGWEDLNKSLQNLSSCLRSLVLHNVGSKPSLESLKSISASAPSSLQSIDLNGRLGKLPPWISKLEMLSEVTLRNTRLGKDAIGELGKLQSLLYLRLYDGSYNERNLGISEGAFPSLKLLKVVDLVTIKMVKFNEGAAHKLEKLILCLKGTDKQEVDIQGMEYLGSLKEVELLGFDGPVDNVLAKRVTEAAGKHPSHPNIKMPRRGGTKDDQVVIPVTEAIEIDRI
ncbi:Disease resistance protein RPM1 [Ananas comosus]|uniref:Disease resistance protein RPM1 n=1 Tax=Ananas comosus TaxID=4615 RepID=A0A199VIG3_ANACO|nr:Disease resistance protein RPM1 [Ananas comosus]